VFDPLRIYRQIIWGLRDELLSSPDLWLCIACETCSRACPQNVKGHLVIRRLQQLAQEEGYVNFEFLRNRPVIERLAYKRFVDEIDLLIT
jgi:heterodisulfide reductase subunit C